MVEIYDYHKMLSFSSLAVADSRLLGILPSIPKISCQFPPKATSNPPIFQKHRSKSLFLLISHVSCSTQQALVVIESERQEEINDREVEEKQPRIRWGAEDNLNLTEEHKHAISQLPFKMTKRCKALMRRIICFPIEEEGKNFLSPLLSSWVKTMKPIRADWLVVMKEMKNIDSPLLLEVMEHALSEDSFEANIRDYTKLIDAYAKKNRLRDAENVFSAMKIRGFECDQIIFTVLIHMYSKAGDLDRAKETFEEIKSLGVPLEKRTYDSMIMAYVRAGQPELGENLLLEMDGQQIYASSEVYKALLRAYSSVGNTNGAQRVFDVIQFAGIIPDVKLCTLLVNAYYVAGQTDNARIAFENMKLVGVIPGDKSIALMLSAYEKENKLGKAITLLMGLERDGIAIGKEATEVLTQWLHRLGLGDDLSDVLGEFSRKQHHRSTCAL